MAIAYGWAAAHATTIASTAEIVPARPVAIRNSDECETAIESHGAPTLRNQDG